MSKVTLQYRGTTSAVKLEWLMKMFGLDYKRQGSGPTTIGKTNRSALIISLVIYYGYQVVEHLAILVTIT